MTGPRNNVETTYTGDDGKFAAGNPGRPKGARHKVTRAVEDMLEGQAEGLTQKAIDMALGGDTTSLKLCLERIAPTRKDTTVQFDLPLMSSSTDAAKGAASILEAVSTGELSPGEGAQVMALVEAYRRTLEVTEIEERIAKLEAKS